MNIKIPPAALEAGRAAFTDAMLTVPQPDPIRAACRAMLEAWPGAYDTEDFYAEKHCFILPLTENPNDKA